MTDYGILGVALVVLFILGFVSQISVVIGTLLIALSVYESRKRHEEIMMVLMAALFEPYDGEQ